MYTVAAASMALHLGSAKCSDHVTLLYASVVQQTDSLSDRPRSLIRSCQILQTPVPMPPSEGSHSFFRSSRSVCENFNLVPQAYDGRGPGRR